MTARAAGCLTDIEHRLLIEPAPDMAPTRSGFYLSRRGN